MCDLDDNKRSSGDATWKLISLKNCVALNQKRLNQQRQVQADNSHWLEMIKDHADVWELDAITRNRLIKQIVIHEDMSGNTIRQTVEIHFNFKNQWEKFRLVRQ